MKCTREQEDKIRKVVQNIFLYVIAIVFVIGVIFITIVDPLAVLTFFIYFGYLIAVFVFSFFVLTLIEWLLGDTHFCDSDE
jgi:archaellum biogenesis protein FlaJ (TadC family)